MNLGEKIESGSPAVNGRKELVSFLGQLVTSPHVVQDELNLLGECTCGIRVKTCVVSGIIQLTMGLVDVLLAIHDNHGEALICRLDDDVSAGTQGIKSQTFFSREVVMGPVEKVIRVIGLGTNNLDIGLKGGNAILRRDPGTFHTERFRVTSVRVKEKLPETDPTIEFREVLTELGLVDLTGSGAKVETLGEELVFWIRDGR